MVDNIRFATELDYHDYILNELTNNDYFGDMVRDKLIYFPTVTREPFRNEGRITAWLESNELFSKIGLPVLDAEHDRAMICGSPSMLKDLTQCLDERGFEISPGLGQQGDYVIERAFRSEERRVGKERSCRR